MSNPAQLVTEVWLDQFKKHGCPENGADCTCLAAEIRRMELEYLPPPQEEKE